MTNAELFQLFTRIQRESKNLFDVTLKLKQVRKQYRKSEFYRSTHMPINKAYEMFAANTIHEIIKFVNKDSIIQFIRGDFTLLREEIETLVENFDYSLLDGIFNKLEEKIAEFDVASLQESLNEVMGRLRAD